MTRSLAAILAMKQLMAPTEISASGETAVLDMQDFNAITFLLNTGAFAFDETNFLKFDVHHSDDDVTYEAASDDDIVSPDVGAHKLIDSGDDQNITHLIHYKGTKRYAKLVYTEEGAVTVDMAIDYVASPKSMPPL